MPYPTDRAERARMRRQILADAVARAHHLGRSITCAEKTDHSTCRGAAVCLCECHDPKERA